MKKCMMAVLGVSCCLALSLCGAGQQFSLGGSKEKQPINYQGTLETVHDKVYEIENISISGALSKIPFYKNSSTLIKNPKLDTEFVDLSQIVQIKRNAKHVEASKTIKNTQDENNQQDNNRSKARSSEALEKEGIFSYNARNYIEVEIVFSSGTQDTYLIELSKEIWCERKDTKTHKEVSFELLKSLTIRHPENSRSGA